jgi:S-adenosylmethionine synthetase
MSKYFFTSESVSEGHPDKMCDQISDSILDAYLKKDPNSRVACETMVSTGLVVVAGEVTSKAVISLDQVVREAIKTIGYDSSEMGFDYRSCAVLNALGAQSADIAMGVDEKNDKEMGAGDQGIMFGYAVNETPELMPLTIHLSHKLMSNLADLRKSGEVKDLRPDSKGQVTVEYVNGVAKRVDTIVVSTQHSESISQEDLRKKLIKHLINPTIPSSMMDSNTKILINPTGRFVIGGPKGDCGLTGRKIIVDTYGGHGAHGGGAFSGKDPTKVDRSAAYMARHIAKNIVASKLADKCLVQLSYAIGIAEPVSVFVNHFGTGKLDQAQLEKLVRDFFPLKPKEIIDYLDLTRPIYKKTAAYGHFGRELPEFSWEKTNKAAELRAVSAA